MREALAACRAGDTLVVTRLDRLARSLPDARAIADDLTTRQISLSLGGSVKGKQPKLSRKQEAHLVSLVHSVIRYRKRALTRAFNVSPQ